MKLYVNALCVLIASMILFSCGTSNKSKTVNDLENHFTANGINGERSNTMFAAIGAVDGIKYRGDDFSIEVYKFEDAGKMPDMLTYRNGSFGMLIHRPTEGEINRKIIDTFNNF